MRWNTIFEQSLGIPQFQHPNIPGKKQLGIGQGNGVGPQIWAAVSSPILNIMRSDRCYAHLIAAVSKAEKKMVGFVFVNDTNLCIYRTWVSTTSIQAEMQQSVNRWEGLLWATRGVLVPTKYFWYLIDFQFTNNAWHYITKPQKPGKLTIKDDMQRWVAILHLEAHEACRTLGVHLEPDRNWETEVDYLLLVTLDWKVCMATLQLTLAEATFSLKHVIMRKLAYPLVTTTLSRHQCQQIMAPIIQQGLPKTGVIWTYPCTLAHGPVEYGGLEIPHHFTEQLIAHMHTLLQYSQDKEDLTGFLLHATGKAMHLEMGYSRELMVAPLILADNITHSWIKHMWITTQEHGMIIIITQRFYRWLITSLKAIANFFDMSNLMEDDVVSGATDNVEK